MTEWRRSRWANPAGWYTAIGVGLLAFSLWIPWLSASRTARVERRANGLAEALLDATRGFEAPLDEADLQTVVARFYLLAGCRGERVKDVERLEPAPDGALLCLVNKHYAFQLSTSPPDVNQQPGRHTVPALEVIAWPQSVIGPGHCAFFYPENAARAFTRNLRARYAGFGEARPTPGAAHRRPRLGSRRSRSYAGRDDERWLLF